MSEVKNIVLVVCFFVNPNCYDLIYLHLPWSCWVSWLTDHTPPSAASSQTIHRWSIIPAEPRSKRCFKSWDPAPLVESSTVYFLFGYLYYVPKSSQYQIPKLNILHVVHLLLYRGCCMCPKTSRFQSSVKHFLFSLYLQKIYTYTLAWFYSELFW